MSETLNKRQLWNTLLAAGLTAQGAAGLMGNLYAESGLCPENLQNSFESRLHYTDMAYTTAVDNGTYRNFVNDNAGYGLAQWTHSSRKSALLAFAKERGCSIGDADMQVAFLLQELQTFPKVWRVLTSAVSVREASDVVMLEFERPADVSAAARDRRAALGERFLRTLGDGTLDNKAVSINSTAEVPESLDMQFHMVVAGDTLTGLAAMYGTTVSDILEKNKAAHPEMTADLIRVGWFLEV
ncbi:MAG: LysM peptidoglycan-binding domain-containing protein [Oscillospiraceae bacterium]|nr:LysM peptidoglycan-binding domain-containing protein [Oscillospiraceae bacterium]